MRRRHHQAVGLARSGEYHSPIVLSIHGIRTRGEWQKTLQSVYGGTSTKTEAFDYGTYSLFKFLTPPFNKRLIDRFYDWYRSIIRSHPEVDLTDYTKRPSLAGHSLGSWVVGRA